VKNDQKKKEPLTL